MTSPDDTFSPTSNRPADQDWEDGHPFLLISNAPVANFKPWAGCIKAANLSWENLPPIARRLQDSQVGELYTWARNEPGVQVRLAVFWPHDFDSYGAPRPSRENWGKRFSGPNPFDTRYMRGAHLNGGPTVPVYVDPKLPPSNTSSWRVSTKLNQNTGNQPDVAGLAQPQTMPIIKTEPSSCAGIPSNVMEATEASRMSLPGPSGSVAGNSSITVPIPEPALYRKFLVKKKTDKRRDMASSNPSSPDKNTQKRPRLSDNDTENFAKSLEDSELTKSLLQALDFSRQQDRKVYEQQAQLRMQKSRLTKFTQRAYDLTRDLSEDAGTMVQGQAGLGAQFARHRGQQLEQTLEWQLARSREGSGSSDSDSLFVRQRRQ
jgi:hypothetical protein